MAMVSRFQVIRHAIRVINTCVKQFNFNVCLIICTSSNVVYRRLFSG